VGTVRPPFNLGGQESGDFALARYEADGDPDPTFSMDGMLTTDLGGFDRAEGVAIAGGSTIVAAGTADTPGGALFAIARYETDGDPDPTFSNDGELTTDLGVRTSDAASGLAVQSGGQILVAGVSRIRSGSPPGFVSEGPGDFVLTRYEPDGDLDPAFSGDGKVDTQVANGFGDRANAVAVQGDGKIVVAGLGIDEQGADDEDFAIARYRADGNPDPTFGGDGILTTDLDGQDSVDVANAVAVQPDGAIVVAGSSDGDFAVARYQPNGDVDTTFGGDGKLTTDFGSGLDEARASPSSRTGRSSSRAARRQAAWPLPATSPMETPTSSAEPTASSPTASLRASPPDRASRSSPTGRSSSPAAPRCSVSPATSRTAIRTPASAATAR
jgi:uncharacterized delta-60 repeat protein